MEKDLRFMLAALEQARLADSEGEVPVGAVITLGDAVIAAGRNQRETGHSALAHAELEAISAACMVVGGWRLCDCTLYVTLEPCPMCAGAIINARIDRVVYGADDPKAGSVGSVINLFALPYNHRPAVTAGVLREECGDLLRAFFRARREQ